MNDEQYLLANAYLDGELTDEERRTAEADPAVMAEVESLRALQAELRAVPAPDPAIREAAIGAALAEFTRRDSAPAAPSTPTTPVPTGRGASPVPLRRRPAYSRILGVAAAVVAVGVFGVVATRGIGGGDDDAAEPAADIGEDAASDAADEDVPARADAPAVATIAPADGDLAGAAEDMAATEAAPEEMSAEQADAPTETLATDAADEAADDEAADDGDILGAPSDPAYDRADAGDVDRPDIDVDAPITDDLELGAYGTYLIEQREFGLLPPTPNTACPPRLQILDSTTAVIDDVARDVYVAVQEIEQVVIAVDRETCAELVDGPLFPPFGG